MFITPNELVWKENGWGKEGRGKYMMLTIELMSRCWVRGKHTHTKNNDSYVYKATNIMFIHILEKAVLALFNESYIERTAKGDIKDMG